MVQKIAFRLLNRVRGVKQSVNEVLSAVYKKRDTSPAASQRPRSNKNRKLQRGNSFQIITHGFCECHGGGAESATNILNARGNKDHEAAPRGH